MTRHFGTLGSWKRADKGNSIVLMGDKPRKIRIEVATWIQTSFIVWLDGLEASFPLGNVNGYEVFEFVHGGDVVIDADANVMYRTDDGAAVHTVLEDAKAFVRHTTQRQRNHAQELAEYKMYQNVNKRIAAVQAEMDRKLMAAGIDPKTGEVKASVPVSPAASPADPAKPKVKSSESEGSDSAPSSEGADGDKPAAGDKPS